MGLWSLLGVSTLLPERAMGPWGPGTRPDRGRIPPPRSALQREWVVAVQVDGSEPYMDKLFAYGINRSDPRFWETCDWFQQQLCGRRCPGTAAQATVIKIGLRSGFPASKFDRGPWR